MSFCVAGMALCDIPTCLITCRKSFGVAGSGAVLLRRFHTMSCNSRGRRGTLETPSSFCVAGAALQTCRIACSTLYTPHSTLHTLHSTLHTSHSTLHTPHSTLYTPHSTLYTPHSLLYTPHSTLHILHSRLYTLHLRSGKRPAKRLFHPTVARSDRAESMGLRL